MCFSDYKRDLAAPGAFNPFWILDRYFHCGQTHAFAEAHPDEEPLFKGQLARALYDALGIELHPLQFVFCGSAHLGFSPVPTNEKFGKPFNPSTSDIDVAVVSSDLFDRWWGELQTIELLEAVRKKVAEDIFWGFINPANAWDVSPIGRKWWKAFGSIETKRANAVRGRLYRNHWSMQSYHLLAINGGRRRLLGKRI